MIKRLTLLIIVIIVASNLFADKYAGEIFKMGAGVRNFSLGRTGLTDHESPAIAYWNSSLLINQNTNTFELMHAEEFKGLLKYDTFSGSFGKTNPVAFTLSRIGINNISMTRLENEDEEISESNRPYKYKSVNNADYILYIGFARKFGNLPIGITPKLVYRNLAEKPAYGFGADLTTHYQANDYFTFGFKIRDIIPTQIYWDNGTRESVNTGFDIEAKINAVMPVINKPLILFINSEINTEGIKKHSFANIGDVSFDPHLGAELKLHQMLSFFTGYDIEHFTAGIGVNYSQFLLNYAFEQNADLDNSHRFSIGYRFE